MSLLMSGKTLRAIAERMVQECVAHGSEGRYEWIKDRPGQLPDHYDITVEAYKHEVLCFNDRAPAQPPSNCDETLGKMRKDFSFATFSEHPVGREIETPEIIIDGKYNCMLVIDLDKGASVEIAFERLWYAAKAIDAKCVRRGLGGWVRGLQRVSAAGQLSIHVSIENGHNCPPRPHNVLGSNSSGNLTAA